MLNSRLSSNWLGWTFAIALLLSAAISIYYISLGMFQHWHDEVAMNQLYQQDLPFK